MTRATRSVRGTVGAVALLVAAAFAYLLSVGTYAGQVVDQAAMTTVSGMFGVTAPTGGILDEVQIPVLAAAIAGLGVACLRRRSLRRCVHATIIVGGATVGAILLKYGLIRPELGVGPRVNSYPSNTVAAFAGVALALIWAVPHAARRLTATLAGLTVGTVATAVIALQWHRPSDVLGGLFVAGAAALAAQAVCAALPAPRPVRHRAVPLPPRRSTAGVP